MGPRKSLKEIIRWNVTKRQSSWLFIEIAEELNSGLLRKIHPVERAGLATQDNGLQAVQLGSVRAAILFLYKALAWQINKPVVSNSVTHNQCHFRQTGLLGSSVTGRKILGAKQQRETDLNILSSFLRRRPWNEQSIWNFYYKNNERNCCPEIKPGAKCHLGSVVVINASSLSKKWHQVGGLRRRHELLLCQHDESWSAGQGAHFKFYLDKTRQVVLNLSGKIMRRSPRFPAHLAEAPSEELLVEDL